MYLCKSGLHYWHDVVDAKVCCNGHERVLAVGNGPVVFGEMPRTFYWSMDDPNQYDEDYVPVPDDTTTQQSTLETTF